MKVKIMLIYFVIFSLALSAQELTFKNYKFGTLIDEIIKKEGVPVSRFDSSQGTLVGDEVINYINVTVANHKAEMEMDFKDKKLIGGGYTFDLSNNTLSLGVSDPREVSKVYNDIFYKLSSLYGKAIKENNIELIEGNISNLLAKEIIQGAPYVAQWECQGGFVLLQATYNNTWALTLIYISPELYIEYKKMKNSTEGL